MIKKYKIGSTVNGKIISIADYGIFVEIEKGIEGLVYNTEISWSKKITGISDIDWNNRQQALMDVYQKGQKIKVKVISIDSKTERLALGIKQLTINIRNTRIFLDQDISVLYTNPSMPFSISTKIP